MNLIESKIIMKKPYNLRRSIFGIVALLFVIVTMSICSGRYISLQIEKANEQANQMTNSQFYVRELKFHIVQIQHQLSQTTPAYQIKHVPTEHALQEVKRTEHFQ